MESRISWLSGFLIVGLLNGFACYQFGLPVGGLYNDKASIPLIILSFGPWIQLVALWWVHVFLKDMAPSERLFARFVQTRFETDRLAYRWERLSALVVLAVPLVAFAWAWNRFMEKGQVFTDVTGGGRAEVHRFEPVPVTLFWRDWNVHRYGDIATGEGASFVPLWQPVLIMGLGTALVCAGSIWMLVVLRGRARIRRRAVNVRSFQ